eukprot:4549140-Amphidinium_carterae.1
MLRMDDGVNSKDKLLGECTSGDPKCLASSSSEISCGVRWKTLLLLILVQHECDRSTRVCVQDSKPIEINQALGDL